MLKEIIHNQTSTSETNVVQSDVQLAGGTVSVSSSGRGYTSSSSSNSVKRRY